MLKHAKSWLTNLDRASDDRKEHSVRAVRNVIIASRETAVYMRSMKDTGNQSHETEAHLSILWTELSFALQDIGITKLAKRCQIKGMHWANPNHYDEDFYKRQMLDLSAWRNLQMKSLYKLTANPSFNQDCLKPTPRIKH